MRSRLPRAEMGLPCDCPANGKTVEVRTQPLVPLLISSALLQSARNAWCASNPPNSAQPVHICIHLVMWRQRWHVSLTFTFFPEVPLKPEATTYLQSSTIWYEILVGIVLNFTLRFWLIDHVPSRIFNPDQCICATEMLIFREVSKSVRNKHVHHS